MKRLTTVSLVTAALAAIVFSGRVQAQSQPQPWAFVLREPIPFYGARLVGFEGGVGLRIATASCDHRTPRWCSSRSSWRSTSRSNTVPAAFREITLTDENEHVYLYRGWLTDTGWIQIDDPDIQTMTPMEAELSGSLRGDLRGSRIDATPRAPLRNLRATLFSSPHSEPRLERRARIWISVSLYLRP